MKKFKPNLVPKVSHMEVKEALEGHYDEYIFSYKKDGIRMELTGGEVLGRSLKAPRSNAVVERFQELATFCGSQGVHLEGEFYSYGMSFRELDRFWKTRDVSEKLNQLQKETKVLNIGGEGDKAVWKYCKNDKEYEIFAKDPNKPQVNRFQTDWPGRTPEWMSTFHPELQIHVFDLYLDQYPDLCYEDRLNWFHSHLTQENGLFYKFRDIIEFNWWFNVPWADHKIQNLASLEYVYKYAIDCGFEGIIAARKTRKYKFDRSTQLEADLFKMKEDELEYDGQVLGISEGTKLIANGPKSTNELGRTVTSKLKEDREPSGIASGIDAMYNGHKINVSFSGYSHDELRDILENKEDYIGRWFRYTGMPPTKNVPRHAHVARNPWRDAK